MILWELLRDFNHEKRFLSVNNLLVSYGDAKTYAGAVEIDNEEQVVGFGFDFYLENPYSSETDCGLVFKIGNYKIVGYEKRLEAYKETDTFYMQGILRIPNGTYNVVFDSLAGHVHLENIRIGRFKLKDQAFIVKTNSASVSADSGADVLNENIILPAIRRTPIGDVAKTHLRIIIYVDGGGNILFKNSGESNSNNYLNVRLKINGAVADFYKRLHERTVASAYFRSIELLENTEKTLNLKVNVYNDYSESKDVNVCMYAYASPWIMPEDWESMVDLNVPFGSTIYVISEPLVKNVTHSIGIGFEKACNYGTDFYDSVSGTGILEYGYTFDVISSRIPRILKWKGYGAGITYLGADIR